MKKGNKSSLEAKSLRQKAEEQFSKKYSGKRPIYTGIDPHKRINELEIDMLALKRQNDDFRRALEKAATVTEKYTALYAFAPTGYFTIDHDGKIDELNLGGASMLGKERFSLVNSNLKEYVSQDTLSIFNDFLEKVFETNFKQICEVRFSIQGNPSIFVQIAGIISENGQKCLLTAVDITEYRLAEENIRHISAVQNLILENSTLGITLVRNRAFEWANARLGELLMLPHEQIQGFPSRVIYPSDEVYEELGEKAYPILARGERSDNTLQLKRSDGTLFWCRFIGKALNPAEVQEGSIWMLEDITESKRVEEALRNSASQFANALKIAHLAPWEYDVVNDLFTFNDSFYAIFRTTAKQEGGYTMSSADYVTRFVYPEDSFIVGSEIRRAIESGDPNYSQQIDHRIIYADGEVGYITVRYYIVKDGKGKTIIIYGVNQDITERKRIEEVLKNSEASLRELNATKDKFFSIIAHDLKNPFNSIIGFSNLLLEQIKEKDYEGIEKYAGIIQKSSQRAMDLLMNLLEWSRCQSGRMEFNPEYFEIISLIKDVIKLLNDSAQQKAISISRKLPHNVPVYADKAMVSTILRNLISNAVKFTNPGGKVVISAKQEQNDLIVSVCDNGIGIKKDTLGKLFHIEESVSTIGTLNEKGTGLGLILCKEFIEKHNGMIWVESEVGKGSVFTFALPLKIGIEKN